MSISACGGNFGGAEAGNPPETDPVYDQASGVPNTNVEDTFAARLLGEVCSKLAHEENGSGCYDIPMDDCLLAMQASTALVSVFGLEDTYTTYQDMINAGLAKQLKSDPSMTLPCVEEVQQLSCDSAEVLSTSGLTDLAALFSTDATASCKNVFILNVN